MLEAQETVNTLLSDGSREVMQNCQWMVAGPVGFQRLVVGLNPATSYEHTVLSTSRVEQHNKEIDNLSIHFLFMRAVTRGFDGIP